jgi:hypothetical protein
MYNEQPFYIGQKVVALKQLHTICKDEVCTVEDCFKCSCGHWHVTLCEKLGKSGKFSCTKCSKMIKQTSLYSGSQASDYAPVTSTYSDITASLAQDAVQERLDVVKPLVKQLS